MNLRMDVFDNWTGEMVDMVVNIAISVARGHMQQYRSYKIRAEADRQKGATIVERGMRLHAESYRLQSYAAVLGLRLAIGIRTDNERAQAERYARTGRARFAATSCADEGCDECAAPLWQHVVVGRSRTLCPGGREYWTYARALDVGPYAPGTRAVDTRLGVIATETRRHG